MNKNNMRKLAGLSLLVASIVMFITGYSIVGATLMGGMGLGFIIHTD